MEIIILPGNSIHNKEWAEELARNLSSVGNCRVQNYRHWQTGEKDIDFEYEIKILAESVRGKKDYILVGKSAGAITILEALSRKIVNPKKCVLMGLPFDFASKHGKDLIRAISSSNIRREFIQNKDDPYGSAETVRKLLTFSKIHNYSFTETIGNTHDYLDYTLIAKLARD